MKSKMMSVALFMSVASLGLVGCAQTAPKTEAAKEGLSDRADVALKAMERADPAIKAEMEKAYGHVIFPEVGKGGLIVGAAFGRGEVFEKGKFIGYAKLEQGTIGLQAGGQSYDELILFENDLALSKFKMGTYAPSANASAVILKSGAAAAAPYNEGTKTFVYARGGAMAEASVGGQKFSFKPATKRDDTMAE